MCEELKELPVPETIQECTQYKIKLIKAAYAGYS